MMYRSFSLFLLCVSVHLAAGVTVDCTKTPYSNGCGSDGPSNEEAYFIDLINSARVDPPSEGQRLANAPNIDSEIKRYYNSYHISPSTLIAQFNSYPVRQPLLWNPLLQASARSHSSEMAARGVQTHDSADGTSFYDRILKTGYVFGGSGGENIYAYTTNPYFGYVGLNADWGVSDLGHRKNIMNFDTFIYREIGVGYIQSHVANFGPFCVSQDFGVPQGVVTAIAGMTYVDSNGNGIYNPGEGVGGVPIVFKNQATAEKLKVKSFASGYYRADLAPGTYTITFQGSFSVAVQDVHISAGSTLRKSCRAPAAGGNGAVTNGVHGGGEDQTPSDDDVDDDTYEAQYVYNNTESADAADQTGTFSDDDVSNTPSNNTQINGLVDAQNNDATALSTSTSTGANGSVAVSSISAMFIAIFAIVFVTIF